MKSIRFPKSIVMNEEKFYFFSSHDRGHQAEQDLKHLKKDGYIVRIKYDGGKHLVYKSKERKNPWRVRGVR